MPAAAFLTYFIGLIRWWEKCFALFCLKKIIIDHIPRTGCCHNWHLSNFIADGRVHGIRLKQFHDSWLLKIIHFSSSAHAIWWLGKTMQAVISNNVPYLPARHHRTGAAHLINFLFGEIFWHLYFSVQTQLLLPRSPRYRAVDGALYDKPFAKLRRMRN